MPEYPERVKILTVKGYLLSSKTKIKNLPETKKILNYITCIILWIIFDAQDECLFINILSIF